MKTIYKSFRIEEYLFRLASLAAASRNRTLSELIRDLLKEHVTKNADSIKKTANEILDIVKNFEKADDTLIAKAEVLRHVYPIPNATKEDYIKLETARQVVEKLTQRGIERGWAETFTLETFVKGEDGWIKMLESLAKNMPTTAEREEARRAIEKRLQER